MTEIDTRTVVSTSVSASSKIVGRLAMHSCITQIEPTTYTSLWISTQVIDNTKTVEETQTQVLVSLVFLPPASCDLIRHLQTDSVTEIQVCSCRRPKDVVFTFFLTSELHCHPGLSAFRLSFVRHLLLNLSTTVRRPRPQRLITSPTWSRL